jgi:two-component system response regulator NreC
MVERQPRRVRVLLADDHVLVRKGIARLIRGEPDMEVVGEASDGREAVEAARTLRPDVVLMDIEMAGLSGIDATRQITQAQPESRVLMLTVYDREDFLFRALQAGAAGYVLKGAEVEDLLRAIRTVDAGEVFVYPRMTTKLVRDYLKGVQGGKGPDEYEKLSVREREVMPLLADGRTNDEIAALLHISKYTVQTYRQRIMQKLNLHSRTELLKYALRKGLIRLEQ